MGVLMPSPKAIHSRLAKDEMKQALGSDIFHKFVKQTKTYKEAVAASDTTKTEEIKKSSFNRFSTYLYMRNSDQNKYGELICRIIQIST